MRIKQFRSILINLTLWLSLINLAHGNISFTMGNDYLERILFSSDVEFTVSNSGSDSSITLVLKDVYSSPTFIPSYNITDLQIFNNTVAIINDTTSSDASLFTSFVDGVTPSPAGAGVDIGPNDILVSFQFSAYDPHISPLSLLVGDTITIKSGSVWDLSDYEVPNPDNLSDQITTQIFASNFPTALTNEQTFAVTPEPATLGFLLGTFALMFSAFRRR